MPATDTPECEIATQVSLAVPYHETEVLTHLKTISAANTPLLVSPISFALDVGIAMILIKLSCSVPPRCFLPEKLFLKIGILTEYDKDIRMNNHILSS
jgi:hypothetical protein